MRTIFLAALSVTIPTFAQTTWTNINNGQSIGSFFGVAGSSTEVVAVGIDGRIATRSNVSGSWTVQTFSGNPDFRDVIYSNGQYVTAREGGSVMTSSDGLTWTPRSSGTSNDLRALLWDGAHYFAAGANGTILKSPDATNWSTVNSSGPFINALAYSGTQFVAAGGFGLLISSDGVTWSAPTSPPASASFEAAAWDGSRFIVGGLGSGIYISTDGQSWSQSNSSITWNVESMVSQGGRTWAVGDNAYIYTTTDGVTWTDLYPNPIGNEFFMDITQVEGDLVVVGFNHTVLEAAIPEPLSLSLCVGVLALFVVGAAKRKWPNRVI